jgi:predicted DNA-binding WGR domain protein
MSKTNSIDQWETPPEQFQAIGFERVNPERNEQRYYYISWQPTLIDDGAVVRIYGRKGGGQQVPTPTPFNSLAEAWPTIRKHIHTRLRHGYRVVNRSLI